MRYVFDVDAKANVNVVGDYSLVNYVAKLRRDPDAPDHIRDTYRGTVRVSPHDEDPFPAIQREIREYVAARHTKELPAQEVEVEQTA